MNLALALSQSSQVFLGNPQTVLIRLHDISKITTEQISEFPSN